MGRWRKLSVPLPEYLHPPTCHLMMESQCSWPACDLRNNFDLFWGCATFGRRIKEPCADFFLVLYQLKIRILRIQLGAEPGTQEIECHNSCIFHFRRRRHLTESCAVAFFFGFCRTHWSWLFESRYALVLAV